jgi:hypothetical protein
LSGSSPHILFYIICIVYTRRSWPFSLLLCRLNIVHVIKTFWHTSLGHGRELIKTIILSTRPRCRYSYYIYIYMCVCVCVCVYFKIRLGWWWRNLVVVIVAVGVLYIIYSRSVFCAKSSVPPEGYIFSVHSSSSFRPKPW